LFLSVYQKYELELDLHNIFVVDIAIYFSRKLQITHYQEHIRKDLFNIDWRTLQV